MGELVGQDPHLGGTSEAQHTTWGTYGAEMDTCGAQHTKWDAYGAGLPFVVCLWGGEHQMGHLWGCVVHLWGRKNHFVALMGPTESPTEALLCPIGPTEHHRTPLSPSVPHRNPIEPH